MTTISHTARRAGLRARAVLALVLVTIAMFGMLIFEIGAAEPANAATASTQSNRVCTRVAVPKYEPWYRCLGNTFTPGTQNNPPGCYTTYKVVCKG